MNFRNFTRLERVSNVIVPLRHSVILFHPQAKMSGSDFAPPNHYRTFSPVILSPIVHTESCE